MRFLLFSSSIGADYTTPSGKINHQQWDCIMPLTEMLLEQGKDSHKVDLSTSGNLIAD